MMLWPPSEPHLTLANRLRIWHRRTAKMRLLVGGVLQRARPACPMSSKMVLTSRGCEPGWHVAASTDTEAWETLTK